MGIPRIHFAEPEGHRQSGNLDDWIRRAITLCVILLLVAGLRVVDPDQSPGSHFSEFLRNLIGRAWFGI